MAYPTVAAPYCFKPVNLVGGQVYTGSTRQYNIASGHATNIFFGEIVIMSSNGCVTSAALTATTVNIVGVFQGCSYVNSLGQRVFSQYYPATISQTPDTVNETVAYVADDPDLVMKVAVVSGTTTIAQATRANLVGGMVALVVNAGSTITGDSAWAVLNAKDASTTTLPFRILDVVPETSPATGSFVEVMVTWNTGVHWMRRNAGV